MTQIDLVRLIESLRQDDSVVIFVTGKNFFFTDKQLCEHHARQGFIIVITFLEDPVHAIKSAQQYITVITGQDRTVIELIALQSV